MMRSFFAAVSFGLALSTVRLNVAAAGDVSVSAPAANETLRRDTNASSSDKMNQGRGPRVDRRTYCTSHADCGTYQYCTFYYRCDSCSACYEYGDSISGGCRSLTNRCCASTYECYCSADYTPSCNEHNVCGICPDSPYEPPPATYDDDGSSTGCFPSSSFVSTKDRGVIRMDALKLFDEVAYYDPAKGVLAYTPVLAFVPHLPHVVSYVRLVETDGGARLAATAKHLIKRVNEFPKGQDDDDVPVGDLRPGDQVRTLAGGVETVESIEFANATGLLAPVTLAGSLFVDGVHVSSFGADVAVTERAIYLKALKAVYAISPSLLMFAQSVLGSRELLQAYTKTKTLLASFFVTASSTCSYYFDPHGHYFTSAPART